LALITEGTQLLTQQIAESVFDSADAEMLVQVSEGWERRLACLPMQPLHGDPHSGNVLNTSQGVLWTDWEDAFIGPIEWDLASLVATPYVFGTDLEKAAAAIKGYGQEIDNAILDLCIEVRTFVALVWSIVLHQQHPSPQRQARIERRLEWFRNREGLV
jgi:thiamine kinase-like enzyme